MTLPDGATAIRGSCLCGSIRLRIDAMDRDVVYCHCTQCRKQSGHYFAASRCRDENLQVTGAEHLHWYQASPQARRGFCRHCGSALFWKMIGSTTTSVLAGCLDSPTGLRAVAHIFVDDQGDYYELADGLPVYARSD